MAKTKTTVTLTSPSGKTTSPVDIGLFAQLAAAASKQPRAKPQADVEVDPVVQAKLEKQIGQEAVSAIQDMDYQELREHIVTLSEHEEETEQAKEKDATLRDLKAQAREAQAPYNETIKGLRARRKLAVLLMQQRGKPTPRVPT
jgi:FtsZ-binding cell division protein ZapB